MSNYTFSPVPNWQLSDGNGKPYSGGLIYTFEAGSTTPKATYNEDETANTNPVVLDSEGRATIKLNSGKYRMVFTDGVSATLFDPTTIEGVLIWDIDNIGNEVQSLQVYDNFAALKAVSSGDLQDGYAAIVQGCYTANDGGGGLFVWDSTSTASTAGTGGVYIIQDDAGTGRWIRQNVDKINPRWFGAKGDGVTDNVTYFADAITYANAHSLPIWLDYGTFYLGSDPFFTLTTPLTIFNAAILKWAGFVLNINPSIPVSDTSQHFSFSSGDDPVFPADAEIKNVWLDGFSTGWYQYSLSSTISALNGASSNIIVIQDNGGTWVSGSLVVSINGTDYTQSYSSNKDTSLTALATQIAADISVDTATYSSTDHTITIVPNTGKSLYVTVTTSGLGGGSTLTTRLIKKITDDLSSNGRLLQNSGTAASANNLSLPNTGNMIAISGTTDVQLISSIGWQSGSEITLSADNQFIIKSGISFSGDYKQIKLSNDSDVTLYTGDNITLKFDGTYWQEIARKSSQSGTVGTFDITFPSTGPNSIFSTTQTITVYYKKETVVPGVLEVVTMSFPSLSATSNSVYLFSLGCLPSDVYKDTLGWFVTCPIVVEDNSLYMSGGVRLQQFNNGAIDFTLSKATGGAGTLIAADDTAPTGPENNFTNSGFKGFPQFTIQYPIFL